MNFLHLFSFGEGCFETGSVSMRPSWSWTYRALPASASTSHMLELKASATMPGPELLIEYFGIECFHQAEEQQGILRGI